MNRTHVAGVGPDAPIVVNEKGAKQSAMPYKFTDFDARHVLLVAAVSARGCEKYGPKNYMGIPTTDHLDHALTHINAFLAGDPQEDHLAHAICRLYFAMATSEAEEARRQKRAEDEEYLQVVFKHILDGPPVAVPAPVSQFPDRTPGCPTTCVAGPDPCPLDPFDDRNRK